MIKLPLTHGYEAILDDCDADQIGYAWRVRFGVTGVKYAIRNIDIGNGKRTVVTLHRQILGLEKGDPNIDHIDGDGLNCRRNNLREVTQKINSINVDGPRKTNLRSPYLGVGWMKKMKKWRARIYYNGRLHEIGRFHDIEEANMARLAAELEMFGIQPRRLDAFVRAGLAAPSPVSIS